MTNEDELMQLSPQDLRGKLMQSTTSDEVDYIISLFNLNLKKKEVIRADVLSDLQDKLAEQIGKRVENNSDTFSNKDLLEYLNSIQSILNKQQKMFETPAPVAVQNNLIIQKSQEELDKDSRDRVMDLVKNILQSQEQPQEQNDNVIDEGEHQGV